MRARQLAAGGHDMPYYLMQNVGAAKSLPSCLLHRTATSHAPTSLSGRRSREATPSRHRHP